MRLLDGFRAHLLAVDARPSLGIVGPRMRNSSAAPDHRGPDSEDPALRRDEQTKKLQTGGCSKAVLLVAGLKVSRRDQHRNGCPLPFAILYHRECAFGDESTAQDREQTSPGEPSPTPLNDRNKLCTSTTGTNIDCTRGSTQGSCACPHAGEDIPRTRSEPWRSERGSRTGMKPEDRVTFC